MARFDTNIPAQADMARSGIAETLAMLRQFSLEDFGEFMLLLPNPKYPYLSSILPRMASAEVQRNWTGTDGYSLLNQTLAFVRLMAESYTALHGRPLHTARILDFGCGYGRILRAMYYYQDPSKLYGCDPWDESLRLCEQDGVLGNLALSDYLPSHLPFAGGFDLIYCFSVFTHLSARAARQCLDTLTDALSPEGGLVITIRPIEYWDRDPSVTGAERAALEHKHKTEGFAFRPHNRAPVDGDVTYGDTSMTLDYIGSKFPRLKIVKTERTVADPLQLVIFLKKI
jgi:SAM-dependent methyltransferase